MSVTSETVVTTLLDSALLRADLEALLDALRLLERDAVSYGPTGFSRVNRAHLEKVLERADLLRQSYSLARARAATQGAGR